MSTAISETQSNDGLARLLQESEDCRLRGRTTEAERLLGKALTQWPDSLEAAMRLAQLALDRQDFGRAIELLQEACQRNPDEPQAALDLAVVHLNTGNPQAAVAVLEASLARTPEFCNGWLLLGQVREALGDELGALTAWYQAITRARRAGWWTDESTTPPQLLDAVLHAVDRVPPDCALNLVDAGEHHWKEGELVMFDDTFKHEAWNRSTSTRIILLMDCWSPYLTPVEKQAVKRLVETISGLQQADRMPNADDRMAAPQ